MTVLLHHAGKSSFVRSLTKKAFYYDHPLLQQDILGMRFKNPIGLAGGFDKNAQVIPMMNCLGFGHMEFGAVTAHPYAGNPGHRCVRLPKDKALVVNYGLMNDGAQVIHRRINDDYGYPVGINIAKTNDPNMKGKDSVEDYIKTYNMFKNHVSYSTFNISCPNTGDGMRFQHPDLFKKLLKRIKEEDKVGPLFVKIGAEVPEKDELFPLLAKEKIIDGIIATNLTKDRSVLKTAIPDTQKGGISGLPVKQKSLQYVKELYNITKGKKLIIGCGGIFTAEDAYERIKAGAHLLQLITGFIYQGPSTPKVINKGLVQFMKKDGYGSIAEAVGTDASDSNLY